MRVLLLGATGNVGSRLLPALVAHGHTVTVYVRNPSKLSDDAKSCAAAVASGSGTDSESIKHAIITHRCDAVMNAAGLAPMFGQSGELPTIFAAVTKAALAVHKERGGEPLRCWFLSGFGILESPKPGYMMLDYIPVYTIHKQNFDHIRSIPEEQLAWSLFCANNLPPRSGTVHYPPEATANADNLIVGVDRPPEWSKTLQWVPWLGTYLNIAVQVQQYFTPLEDCVDLIASDFSAGLESQLIGHRVSMKLKPKSS